MPPVPGTPRRPRRPALLPLLALALPWATAAGAVPDRELDHLLATKLARSGFTRRVA